MALNPWPLCGERWWRTESAPQGEAERMAASPSSLEVPPSRAEVSTWRDAEATLYARVPAREHHRDVALRAEEAS